MRKVSTSCWSCSPCCSSMVANCCVKSETANKVGTRKCGRISKSLKVCRGTTSNFGERRKRCRIKTKWWSPLGNGWGIVYSKSVQSFCFVKVRRETGRKEKKERKGVLHRSFPCVLLLEMRIRGIIWSCGLGAANPSLHLGWEGRSTKITGKVKKIKSPFFQLHLSRFPSSGAVWLVGCCSGQQLLRHRHLYGNGGARFPSSPPIPPFVFSSSLSSPSRVCLGSPISYEEAT